LELSSGGLVGTQFRRFGWNSVPEYKNKKCKIYTSYF